MKKITGLVCLLFTGYLHAGTITIQSESSSGGSGSSSAIGVFKDGVQVTSPTAQINIIGSSGLNATAAGSTATLIMTTNLPGGSTSYLASSASTTFTSSLLQISSFTSFTSSMPVSYLGISSAPAQPKYFTVSLTTGVSGTLPIGNLTASASNYWNYPSSGTFVNSSGISVSTILVTSSITITSAQTPASSSLRGQLELNAGSSAARLLMGTNNSGVVYSWIQAAESSLSDRVLALNPVDGTVVIGATGPSFLNNGLEVVGDLSTSDGLFLNGTDGTAGQVATSGGSGGIATWTTPSGSVSGSTGSVGISIDGGGAAIVSGSTRSVTIPYGCTVSSWTIIADQSGSIAVHVSSSTFENYPTLSNMSGFGNGPKLTSQQKNGNSTSNWTGTSIAQRTVLSFVVDSASTVTWVNIILWLVKT